MEEPVFVTVVCANTPKGSAVPIPMGPSMEVAALAAARQGAVRFSDQLRHKAAYHRIQTP